MAKRLCSQTVTSTNVYHTYDVSGTNLHHDPVRVGTLILPMEKLKQRKVKYNSQYQITCEWKIQVRIQGIIP
jgi:hypothetical protein